MGLFDRFKKRFKKSSEDEISADEDSAEAKQASEEGAQMRQDIAKKRKPLSRPHKSKNQTMSGMTMMTSSLIHSLQLPQIVSRRKRLREQHP